MDTRVSKHGRLKKIKNLISHLLNSLGRGFPRMIEAGKTPRLVSWGSYEQQRAKLYEMQRRAMKDFKDFAEYLVRILSNRELLVQEQKLERTLWWCCVGMSQNHLGTIWVPYS